MAYFASWGEQALKGDYGVDDIPFDKLTHINYAFAGVGRDYRLMLLDSAAAIGKSYAGQDAALAYRGQFNLFRISGTEVLYCITTTFIALANR